MGWLPIWHWKELSNSPTVTLEYLVLYQRYIYYRWLPPIFARGHSKVLYTNFNVGAKSGAKKRRTVFRSPNSISKIQFQIPSFDNLYSFARRLLPPAMDALTENWRPGGQIWKTKKSEAHHSAQYVLVLCQRFVSFPLWQSRGLLLEIGNSTTIVVQFLCGGLSIPRENRIISLVPTLKYPINPYPYILTILVLIK